MIYIKRSSDILYVNKGFIVHQVNCLGKMGRGLAYDLKMKYPNAVRSYQNVCRKYKDNPKRLLGAVCKGVAKMDLIIVNMFSQLDYGTDEAKTDYEAMRKAFTLIEQQISKAKLGDEMAVNIPYKIGCGLGGGDWNIVLGIIRDVFEKSPVKVVIHQRSGDN